MAARRQRAEPDRAVGGKVRSFLTKKHLAAIIGALFAALLILAMTGCGEDRAQAASDARAGIQAAVEIAPEAGPILAGVDARLPAASGVNSADWPAPTWPKERIKADPVGYGNSAPPEPARWGFLAVLGGAGVAALGLLRVVAPLIPGGGPIVKVVADMAWSVMAHGDQKKADAAAQTARQAATYLIDIVLAAQRLPPGTMPENIEQLLAAPIVNSAIEHLAKAPKP